ncbi:MULTISPECIES: ParB/RepB/Spo0J family partition protein [unclassified Nitrosomonas]|jgi:ParB family chromosome partitioning protein|uniref:ParB/RepB/Spo0J family partition protein n=1 Tax=unclassified Nitrosomonas TaxID=2609265 RepID=UPI00087E31BB|nr:MULTISPECIES: ParB/RepB/Spo0J family partition protein [unclassified Nitrosomonas]SDH44924.1 chromosome partitioning protein, ParB family [Nitrosomonas sp. Nm132]SDZ07254.1 chromosome partitioning protein, ParB family [Nitrosomonas sp. Nm58]
MVIKKTLSEDANKAPAVLGASQIPLDLIIEDVTQPRKIFDPASLAELTETIKLRGVKTPISVRPNPDKPGTYIINHGARRYRASKSAELKSIPAYIDADYSLADQVVENLQRDNLTSREIVDYIGREIAAGKTHEQIGKSIGKSASYVSLHAAALDLPDPIAELFNSGNLTDIAAIFNLKKIFKTYPLELVDWLKYSRPEDITRSKIQQFRKFLESKVDEKSIVEELTRQAPYPATDSLETQAEKKERSHKSPADQLLIYIYVRLKKRTHQPQDIMRKLSDAQKTMISDTLKAYFIAGQKCKDLFHSILDSLKDGDFDGTGRGAFNLTAFFFGVNKKEFDLEMIIQEVYLNLSK